MSCLPTVRVRVPETVAPIHSRCRNTYSARGIPELWLFVFRPEDISMTKLLASAKKHGLELFCSGFPGAQATQVCHNPVSG